MLSYTTFDHSFGGFPLKTDVDKYKVVMMIE